MIYVLSRIPCAMFVDWLHVPGIRVSQATGALAQQSSREIETPVSTVRTMHEFSSVDVSVHNHFPTEHYLQDRNAHKQARATALAEWRGLLAD
jgi:hypothetical protein